MNIFVDASALFAVGYWGALAWGTVGLLAAWCVACFLLFAGGQRYGTSNIRGIALLALGGMFVCAGLMPIFGAFQW